MEADALLHIGTHKTGTTSFQRWAHDARDALAEHRDVDLYQGRYGFSHVEVALLCLRRNRTIAMQSEITDWCLDEWRDEIGARLSDLVSGGAAHVLVTAEALSLLRYEDEVERLAEALAPRPIRAVVCLRDPHDFLRSYRDQLVASGRAPSRYRSSFAYVEPDTWLVRWDDMVETWRRVLGDDAIRTVRYEDAIAAEGTTIPAVLRALDVDPIGLPDGGDYRLNTSSPPAASEQIRQKARLQLSRLKRRLAPRPTTGTRHD